MKQNIFSNAAVDQSISYLLINLKGFLILLLCCFIPLHAAPDLTIVGYVLPEDGLGKIPITILETLGDHISTNLILTKNIPMNSNSQYLKAAIENPDQSPGNVALLTEGIANRWSVPASFVPEESHIKLAYSMFETTKIPDSWVEILNRSFDAVVVPDQYYVGVYQNCGVDIPIFVLPIPMMLEAYFSHPIHQATPSDPFVFLDASANKNPTVLIEAFAKAFRNDAHVQLRMRAGVIRPINRDLIQQLIAKFELSNVIVDEGLIPLSGFIDCLADADCYINLSRGEGFSFIPREALALGVPVIATNNTAVTTICDAGFIRAVPSQIRRPPLEVYKEIFNADCGEQFDCDVDDVASALLDIYNNYSHYLQKAREGRKWVDQYNCTNIELQQRYRTLIKPKEVILGTENIITNEIIITTSPTLEQKYQKLIRGFK